MTQTRRLFINVIVSHARSLYGLVVGLLTGRWALLALGHESYGLLGLVGGLIAFVSLFNMVFSNAVVRYYSVAIGEAQSGDEVGVGQCRRWFNVVLFVHIVVPMVLLIVGYPVGAWLVKHFLSIPAERVADCVWVFRFTCLTCFVGMVNVPFRAMYVAKQRIAELTVYSFCQTTGHVIVLGYFVSHPGDWLIAMAVWYFLQQTIPSLIMSGRAIRLFPECRFVARYMVDMKRLRNISGFAGWQFVGSLGMMLRNQGVGILINKYLGAIFNATGSIATTVSGQAQMFANEVNVAFAPAISTAYGAKDRSLMVALVTRCSKFSSLLVLLLALPLMMEMEYIVTLWLKEPPPCAATLALFSCGVTVLNKMTCGQEVAINACGRIAGMQVWLFVFYMGVAGLTWIFFSLGYGIVWAGLASFLMMGLISLARIVLSRKLLGFSSREWLKDVFLPVVFVVAPTAAVGIGLKSLWASSFVRAVIVCGMTGITFLVSCWLVGLTKDERSFVVQKFQMCVLPRLRGMR